jgi:magnesium chelatase subunit H
LVKKPNSIHTGARLMIMNNSARKVQIENLSARVVIVTMDSHLASATVRAQSVLSRSFPGLTLTVHAASEWGNSPSALQRCIEDIEQADIVIAAMLFLEDHYLPVLPALTARRDKCDAMICALSAGEVMRLTRMGKFSMDGKTSGPMALLKRLKGNSKPGEGSKPSAAGARQMKIVRQLPKILRFIPGTAQDVRIYFLVLQYWLAGSEENITSMIAMLLDNYADGPRRALRGQFKVKPPVEYPEVGIYHQNMKGVAQNKGMSELTSDLPSVAKTGKRGTVGLLLLRSYLVAGNAAHYNGVITALEARGMRVVPAFATGLDARPAVEKFFMKDGRSTVDAIISLTGFSMVGGPAYNDSKSAEEILAKLDVYYLSVMPVEFQTLERWGANERGLMPVEATMMVAIPELDGSTGPLVFGGRSTGAGDQCTGCSRRCVFPASENEHDMQVCIERADMLASRVGKLIDLKRAERANKKIAAVVFNFPPNAGATGTAAFLSVFESMFNMLASMKEAGYTITMPKDVDDLRESVIKGNAEQYGAMANVHATISVDDHVRRERWLKEIEAHWGPAPGQQQSDGRSIFVLGAQFGNVLVGIQPAFGYEGDPMRLLYEKGFAPTHAFSAFYRYLREDFGATAVLHFGTHGALEFMPGKQAGMSGDCWPDRLIGDLPNFYLYASNNPSEGMIAKRRAAATLISYMTPPIAQAGLYSGLIDLKASLERLRGLDPESESERAELTVLVQTQAAELELATMEPAWSEDDHEKIQKLYNDVLEFEYTLIPEGLHVIGRPMSVAERTDMLLSVADASHGVQPTPELRNTIQAMLTESKSLVIAPERAELMNALAEIDRVMCQDNEINGILHALDGGYVRPAPGGDLIRTPEVLPTGRNLHGFDPFRLPSAFAVKDGKRMAEHLLQRHIQDGNPLPETIAMVLWGTDNLKSEGAPIAQALALMGAKPRFDSYGRLAGAELLPLEEVGRPRIDVVITLSGIFRDLLPMQIKLLAEAAYLAAKADESSEMNFIRKHALAHQAEHGCDLETAALRVFGNAEGAYGSNVSQLVDNSRWEDEDELAETYTKRKGFAYGVSGRPVQQTALLKSVLSGVDLAYQNLDSVELGVTTIDTYFDTLGGISRAVKRAKGPDAPVAPVYISDQTKGSGTVRTLTEQVALETRTRMLNPKWYEGLLKNGYEGVRQIELHVTNTMGWSATTGQVQPWVYQKLTETFMLDTEMRERMAKLNPTAAARVASRLLEASNREFWKPDDETLAQLKRAEEDLEDRLEGIYEE